MKSQSTPLPLRSSVVWGGYREAVLLPHRYGYAAGGLIQYDQARTQFLWADHACIAIDEVLNGGKSAGGWVLRNTVDSTGRPIALVVFDRAIDEGSELIARGRGKPSPTSGQLMTNPADVVLDILAVIAGRPVTAAQLEPFRRACDREGIDVGGSIEGTDSDQTVIRELVASVGGIYCADMPALCQLWPGVAIAPARLTLADGDTPSADVDLDDLVNQLTIRFQYEGDTPRASVVLESPDSIARYGLRPSTLEARWLTSARVAAAVGTRLLAQQARPVWLIAATTEHALSVGDTVSCQHPALPVTGDAVVLSREIDFDTGATGYTCRIPAGAAPRVKLVSQSSAYEPNQYASGSIVTQGGSRVITLVEADGSPIAFAQVTLDGGTQIRQTDAGGHVAFPVDSMPIGVHTLHIVTTDGRTLDLPIEVS